jgi:2-oxoglutarate/2-oxoacid ferredoxin oxidoreductase subunit alpha
MAKQLMKGNDAIGEAAIRAGVEAYFGYPITPQTELLEYMARRMPEEGRVFLQAESELAAINMVYGAACTGARVMTSSSSPGISLMQEGISYIVCSRVPAVIVDIVRGGPGLGNIQPSQSDYFQIVKGGGHGDYHPIVLAPASVQEAVDLTVLAFDLAWQYRHVAVVLGDSNIGQVMEPCTLPPARPLPTERPHWATFGAEGRAHRIITSLALVPEVLEEWNKQIQAVQRQIVANEVRWQEYMMDGAEIVVVAYGIMGRICQTAIKRARAHRVPVGLVRPVSLYPFPYERIAQLADRGEAFLVAEMSAGQMVEDVQLAVGRQAPVHFFGRMGGMVPDPDEVQAEIEFLAEKCARAARHRRAARI